MLYQRGVEPHAPKGHLHDGPRGKGADQRADPHRAAQKPTDQGGGPQQRDADGADGDAPGALGEPHQERVPGPAAQGGQHVGVLGVGQDHQPREQAGDAGEQRAAGWDEAQPVEEVHGLAHHEGVDEHGDADGLPHEHVDAQNGQRHGHGGGAVEDAQRLGEAQTEHVPGRRP